MQALESFKEIASKEASLLIEGLWDAPKAALIAALHTTANIVVITGGLRENRLLDDFSYFGLHHIYDFPSWETLPMEEIAPNPDISGKRLEILHTLLRQKKTAILLCPLQAVLQQLPSPETLRPLCKKLSKGDTLSFSSLTSFLSSLGYKKVAVVSDKGEFAVRGGICDLFPIASSDPFRLDFFGDTIEEIRTFDPISQKSIAKVNSLFLSPASELDLLRKEKTSASLFDYVGPNTVVIFDDLAAIEDKYVSLKSMLQGAPTDRKKWFATFEELMQRIEPLQKIYWLEQRAEELSEVRMEHRVGRAFYANQDALQPLSFEMLGLTLSSKRWQHPFLSLTDLFGSDLLHGIGGRAKSDLKIHFICSTESEEHTMKARLSKEEIPLSPSTVFERGYLSSGLALKTDPTVLVPMTELTHRYRVRRPKWRSTYHTPASDFHELHPGDIVVHFHNGIGRYLGVEKKPNHLGQLSEFLLLEYAEGSKLYVPIDQSHLVSRYIGAAEEVPTFSVLGTQKWQKTKLQAQKAIVGYAQDLLKLHAERAVHGGFIYPPDGEDMTSFEEDFPFNETEDQLKAIGDIKSDMSSEKAMDRLICGDVGYGKTEVAMRAAFKAVADGKKQVAVLVPTTILAMQHYETFFERMVNFPVRVGVISRFRSQKEIKQTLKEAAEGSLDILIGTHRLISKDVRFHNLGLIIIDEEQRFGVRAKEHLKRFKVGVDCLTLSATPIPRTLYLSLIGAREISIINTPPQDRLPIKTIIAQKEPSLVQNALLRELSRDGQAFIIHNRVETIFQVSEEIQKLLPSARIVVGHGQMSSDELDTVFHAFKSGTADILIATTIVENGIDIPNANTILIDRADMFGLADLYQLRGRVGRWNRPAYAYFLYPPHRQLPELTRKRLYALAEASGYGGGMKIAMRDLEIRGAGDILGTQQSGQISSIGFHLYCKLLKRTIDALKKRAPPSFIETKVEFSYDARLPDTYIDEPSIRLEIYHRLGEASSPSDVDAILAELKDRFGPVPEPVIWLYHLTRIRILASSQHIISLKFDKRSLTIERPQGKETAKTMHLLPSFKQPKELETFVSSLLTLQKK